MRERRVFNEADLDGADQVAGETLGLAGKLRAAQDVVRLFGLEKCETSAPVNIKEAGDGASGHS